MPQTQHFLLFSLLVYASLYLHVYFNIMF